MSKVLIDNWGISECVYNKFIDENWFDRYSDYSSVYRGNYEYRKEFIDNCWQSLLTSIVLWDSIYINQEPTSSRRFEHEAMMSILYSHCNGTNFNEFFKSFVSFDNYPYIIEEKSVLDDINHSILVSNQNNELKRALYYLKQAQIIGCNYLPHPVRSELLLKTGYFEKLTQSRISALNYTNQIDKSVKEFFERLEEINDFQLQKIQFPVLYNFIISNCGSAEEQIRFACSLRNNKNVIKFRESINKIGDELEKGNYLAYKSSLLEVKEICDEITNSIYKKPKSFSVSLGITPTFNQHIELSPTMSLGVNIDLPKKVRSNLHTTFLYDLASFAYKGETKRKY